MNDDHGIIELTADMPGTYLLTTQSGSSYLVEIDRGHQTRFLRTPAAFTMNALWVPSQYGDGDPMMCAIVQMRVGLPGAYEYLKVERALEDPNYFGSTRFTTVIESIERVDVS